jgi:glycosyltransferase involved in cell wall biosynthesis
MKSSTENLNIALVHEWITNVAGAERVLLSLKELFPQAPIYTAVFDPEKAKPFKAFDVRTSFLQKLPLMKSKRELLIPLTPFAFEQFDLSGYDVVISSTTVAAKGVITKPDTIHISYCHTPPRYLWEPDTDPRARKGKFSWLREATIHKMRLWDRVAADRVDEFIANSKYVAKRIKKYYGRDAVVIYPGVDTEKFTVGDPAEVKDYYLFVSRLVDYKRCDIVVEAFNKLKLPLKVIGRGPEREKLVKMAGDNIEFLGFLSDEDMKKYYREAKAFIFAAEEDFGIVPVEAMACGRPVIAFGKGGATESVVEGVTGTFFPEQTAESLITAVKSFNPAKFDPLAIRKHAEKFSVARFKKEILEYVENIIKNKKMLNKGEK